MNKENQMNINKGDLVQFGAYPQELEEKPTPIEWLVLDREADSLVLLSKMALDCMPYYHDQTACTWETSDIRAYLNKEFILTAFSDEERDRILESCVSADKNPEYATEVGNDTCDRVFLLSAVEAEKYFEAVSGRVCSATAHAVRAGAFVSPHGDTKGNSVWWLRTQGSFAGGVAMVGKNGKIYYDGERAIDTFYVVRPAIRVRLDQENE